MLLRVHTAAVAAVVALLAATSQAAVHEFEAFMDGPSESPPNASPGTGFVTVDYDDVAHTLTIDATFGDLIGTTTVAHIHAPTAAPFAGAVGVAVTPGTLPGFPVGVTGGVYASVIDLTLPANYTAAFLTLGGGTAAGAEALLFSSILEGKAYFNIHSSFAGGGEIRGFLVPIPEPASAMLVLGGAPLLLRRRG